MGVNSLPKTVTRQRRSCDLNPGPSAPETSTLTTRLYRATPYLTKDKSPVSEREEHHVKNGDKNDESHKSQLQFE